jgi:diguanylate cyclase (GGDEF)-like protein
MPEPLPNPDPTSSREARKQIWARPTVWAICFILEAATLAGLIYFLAKGDLELAAYLGQFLLIVALAATAAWVVQKRLQDFYGPMRMLETLLPQVRAGEVPIEELSKVGGKLNDLAGQIQEIFRELRQQEGQIDSEIRQRIANRTSALERKLGSLRQQAARDALTGLYNRRMFQEQLKEAIEQWKQSGQPLILMMIDIDHFKILNDTLGHSVGDDFLRSVAQLIRSSIRSDDLAFRWGGDEFAVLLQNTDEAAARKLADRLVSLADTIAKTHQVPKRPSLSIGFANINLISDHSEEAIVEAADRVLYRTKAERKANPPRMAS